MPETTTTTVVTDPNGYYKIAIPKALGDSMDLDGAQLEWSVESGKSLKARKVDND